MNFSMSKTILFLIFCVFCQSASYAQKNLTYSEKTEMVRASYEVSLADEIITEAKDYGRVNNYEIKNIEKNMIHLKVIFNETLDARKRFYYCNYLLELFAENKSIFDTELIERQKRKLLKELTNE